MKYEELNPEMSFNISNIEILVAIRYKNFVSSHVCCNFFEIFYLFKS